MHTSLLAASFPCICLYCGFLSAASRYLFHCTGLQLSLNSARSALEECRECVHESPCPRNSTPFPFSSAWDSSMADSIRGYGLNQAHVALAALARQPELLERARLRFSRTPPFYASPPSHGSTESVGPTPPDQGAGWQEAQAHIDHQASKLMTKWQTNGERNECEFSKTQPTQLTPCRPAQ